MSFLMALLMQGVLMGLVVVASNPSPYFGALGLVVVSGVGCGLLALSGGTFLPLILFLIYLGGMLVVFAYCSALASEPYPESWGSPRIALNSLVYLLGVTMAAGFFWWGWFGGLEGVGGASELCTTVADLSGVAFMYSWGGMMLVAGGWVLVVALFVVLEFVRGSSRGALRVV